MRCKSRSAFPPPLPPSSNMVKLNRMVLTQGFGFILLPVIAVAVTKFYGDSPEETEKKLVGW